MATDPLVPDQTVLRRPSLVSQILAVAAIAALLAAIVVPLILNELKKSNDRATKADVLAVARAIEAYVAVDGELPTLSLREGDVLVDGTWADTLSDGVVLGSLHGDAEDWCIDATQPEGDHAKLEGYHYDLEKEEVVTGLCP